MAHASDSTPQKKIEEIIREKFSRKIQTTLQSGKLSFPDNERKVTFQIDGCDNLENPTIICEIYAGIDTLKPGQKKKIATDLLKLILLEKMLNKIVKKYILFADEKILKSISEGSWTSLVLKEFQIRAEYVKLSASHLNSIRKAKKRQTLGMKRN